MRGERSSRQGVKLLYIRDYLYTHAAKEHPTGVLHFDGFESLTTVKIADTRMGICYFWQRMRDSNPRKRSQSPVCYRYTNPLGGDYGTRTCDLMRVKHAL